MMLPIASVGDPSNPIQFWPFLSHLVILIAVALLLGLVFERLRQSAVLGFLLAGTLLGPGVFGVVRSESGVAILAELGVSLLLFAIGLEFSARRLLQLGRIAVGGETLCYRDYNPTGTTTVVTANGLGNSKLRGQICAAFTEKRPVY